MVELGKYAATVLTAYGASLALLAGLIGVTLWKGARAKRALAAAESEQARHG